MSIEFLMTSLIVVLLPGTGALYTMAIGLGQGAWPSVLAVVGCCMAIMLHIVASVVGLAALLHASALAFEIVRYLGVVWLLYMAWGILREGGTLDLAPDRRQHRAGQIILRGFLLNILNPKLSVFFLAFLPQFVPVDAVSPTSYLLGLGMAFNAMTFIVFVIYGLAAAQARDHVISRPRVMLWLRRSFAGIFALLSLRLALAER